MSTHTLGLFLHHLGLSNEVSRLGHSSDRALLVLYDAERCEPAFTELMRRYGPMVLRVCRRVLGHGQDAEDVFQATFLLLARRTGQLLCETGTFSLGGWLHRVAYRTALNATTQATRRKSRERQAANMSSKHIGPETDADWNEVRPILDAELDALPEESRRLLVACYLQSKTHAEAAAELGVPLGSMAGRLEKAKALLAARLARRGIIVSAPFLATCLGNEAIGAVVPARLLVHSVEAVMTFAEQANGAVSGTVARLVKLGLANGTKTSTGTGLVIAGSLAVLAAGLVAYQTLMAEPNDRPPADPPPVLTAEPPVKGDAIEPVDRAGDTLPQNALARMGTVRYRTATGGGGHRSVQFTADGQGIVTAGGLNPLCLWDTRSGKLVRRFGGYYQHVGQPIALSPDGKVLAGVEASSRRLSLWDVATGKVLSEVPEKLGELRCLAFSADGKSVASMGMNDKLCVWDAATGRALWGQSRVLHAHAIVFGADDKTVIAIETKGLSFWDAATGQKAPGQLSSDRPITSAVLSPDRGTLAVVRDRLRKGADIECDVAVIDLVTLKEVRQLAPYPDRRFMSNPIQSVAVSSGGKVLAEANGAGELRLWDLETGQEVRRCEGGRNFVDVMAFSADGKLLAGLDMGRVRVWETASGKEVAAGPNGHDDLVVSVAFLPDGSLVSTSRDGVTRTWDSVTGAERTRVARAVLSAGLVAVGEASTAAPNGKTMILGDIAWPTEDGKSFFALIRTWDRTTDHELTRVLKKLGDTPMYSMALSPDGRIVVSAGGRGPAGGVEIWESATGKAISRAEGRLPAISDDGKWLATVRGGKNAVLTLWDVATGKELGSAPVPDGCTVARLLFAPHRQMLASVSETRGKNVVHFWPLSPGPELSSLHIGTPRLVVADVPPTVRELAFSPDARTFALPDGGGAVRLLETATGQERMWFKGQVGYVRCLAFSADGRRLATGSSDTTVLVWDLTGRFRDGKLRPVAVSAKEREEFWTDLASDNATRAARDMWALAADPAQTVPFLARELNAISTQIAPELIAKHVRALDDPAFAVREKAHSELKLLGDLAEPALWAVLKDPASAEVRSRAEQLLKVIEARKRYPSGVVLRGLRAIEVLEQIGTPDARAVLKEQSRGPDGLILTQEAQMALTRLGQKK